MGTGTLHSDGDRTIDGSPGGRDGLHDHDLAAWDHPTDRPHRRTLPAIRRPGALGLRLAAARRLHPRERCRFPRDIPRRRPGTVDGQIGADGGRSERPTRPRGGPRTEGEYPRERELDPQESHPEYGPGDLWIVILRRSSTSCWPAAA